MQVGDGGDPAGVGNSAENGAAIVNGITHQATDSAASGAPSGGVTLSLVVPTRNEASNIPELFARVDAALQGIAYEIVVVDDSDDETPSVVERQASRVPAVQLIHREGAERVGGLAGAVVEGCRVARGACLAILDADLQHPPEKIPALLAALERADVAVASRYIPGGSSRGLEGPVRHLGSVGAKLLGQLVVRNARRSTDPLGGFFAFRREVIEGVGLRPIGYKILLEILARGHVKRVAEVPYTFEPRFSGQSKADLRQMRLYLQHLVRLRFGWG